MLDIFKKKNEGTTVEFKIDGMHCTSCSINIDAELEDTEGVINASTSYAKAQSKVSFDPKKVSKEQLKQVIKKLEYTVKEVS